MDRAVTVSPGKLVIFTRPDTVWLGGGGGGRGGGVGGGVTASVRPTSCELFNLSPGKLTFRVRPVTKLGGVGWGGGVKLQYPCVRYLVNCSTFCNQTLYSRLSS